MHPNISQCAATKSRSEEVSLLARHHEYNLSDSEHILEIAPGVRSLNGQGKQGRVVATSDEVTKTKPSQPAAAYLFRGRHNKPGDKGSSPSASE